MYRHRGAPNLASVRAPPISIWLCGEFRIEVGREPVHSGLCRRKSRVLLALLALNEHGLSRERLVELLWPEEPFGSRGGALRQLFCDLRQAIGADLIEGLQVARLALPPGGYIDVIDAELAVERAGEELTQQAWGAARKSSGRALAVLDGEFLAGESASWIEERRRDLERLAVIAAEAFGEACLHESSFRWAGERAARALIERAPYREEAWGLLMRTLIVQGNCAEALDVFDRVRIRLRDELGTAPSSKLRELHRCALEGRLDRSLA